MKYDNNFEVGDIFFSIIRKDELEVCLLMSIDDKGIIEYVNQHGQIHRVHKSHAMNFTQLKFIFENFISTKKFHPIGEYTGDANINIWLGG